MSVPRARINQKKEASDSDSEEEKRLPISAIKTTPKVIEVSETHNSAEDLKQNMPLIQSFSFGSVNETSEPRNSNAYLDSYLEAA